MLAPYCYIKNNLIKKVVIILLHPTLSHTFEFVCIWFGPYYKSNNDHTKLLFEVAQHFYPRNKMVYFRNKYLYIRCQQRLLLLVMLAPSIFFLLNSQSKQEHGAGLGVGCCSSEKLFELFELAKSRRIKQQCNLRGWYDSSKHGIVVHRCM